MTTTRKEATEFIATAIEANGVDVASRDEYDLDAIADDLYSLAGSWDVASVEHDTFWATVEQHELRP